MLLHSRNNHSGRPSGRRARLALESLEDRLAPHTGVALFSAGLTAGALPAGIVFVPQDGNHWFAEFGASRIARITTGGTITEFTLPAGRGPLNLTVGPDNNIWFTENSAGGIGRINPLAGDDAAIQASLAEFAVPAGTTSMPNDITTGPDGALWFTESGTDKIGRITTAGMVTNEFAVPKTGANSSLPSGITAGADGNLWFTEGGSGEIGRITTAGVVTEFTIPIPNPAAFSDPEDIVAGPGGNLFFTDFGRDQIGRITPDGQITQFNLPLGRGPQQIVAFDDGDLYFTEAASSRVGRLPSSALVPGAPAGPGVATPGSSPGASTLVPLEEFDFIPRDSVPLGIAISGSGDIWFTLNNGNAIGNFLAHLQQITATSTGGTVQEVDVHFNPVRTFQPFPGFNGNLSLSVSDTNRNGVPDVIVGAGAGGPSAVMVLDGSDNRVLASFYAFDPAYLGGVTVTSEDVNGDGYADIIVAAGAGTRAHVKVIDGFQLFSPVGPLGGGGVIQPNGQIADSALLASFFAFAPGFLGGVSLAAGDVNFDGKNDIIVGAGVGASAHVKVIDATKLGQVNADGQIADSALLGSFYAFDPGFVGGIFVAVSKNIVRREIVVGSGAGSTPHVVVVDGTKLGDVQANGEIAPSALLASFFAFGSGFTGGARVAADDLNFDGLGELIVTAGPGTGAHVKVVDGAKTGQVLGDGQISDAALLDSTIIGPPGFAGGVSVASDADHRDARFGPPNVTVAQSRGDVNDMYIFQSPANAANTVLGMTVSPFSTSVTPNAFDPNVTFDQRIINSDLLNAPDDLVFRYNFGAPDPAAGGRQDVQLRALPSAKFAGVGGVLVKGFTNQNLAVRGVGGTGAQFRAAEQSDPFFFDASGFNSGTNPKALLNHTTAAAALAAGDYPRGTGTPGPGGEPFYAPGGNPNFDAQSFFAGANTLALVLEIPSSNITGKAVDSVTNDPVVGYWGRAEINGVQTDSMGRPAINTALIPAVPRGINFPADGSSVPRTNIRDSFNTHIPRTDRAVFGDAMAAVLAAFYPAGRPTDGADPAADLAQAKIVASLLLPDILVYRPTSKAGFFGDTVGTLGQPDFFLAGGRKFSDNIIDTELQILTDPDTPFNLDGGVNQPAFVMTQNVRDHNGQNLPDGSIDKPLNQGGMGTGQRPIAFPYIGAPNTPAVAIPNPPGPIKP